MLIKQLPMIYNLDQVRIYKNKGGLLADFGIGQQDITWYLKNNENYAPLLDAKIHDMAIQIEGCLSETIVLEIVIK